MPNSVNLRGPDGPVTARVALPQGKSLANRALVLAALAGDLSCVQGAGNADDTRILHQLLRERPHRMHCGDGGTTMRFLLAWACVQQGREHFITGSERLLQRPHGPLVQALRTMGADITARGDGFLVRGKRLGGGHVALHASPSSQFISALLLVGTTFTQGLELRWTGQRLSEPYVRMTIALCRHFGIAVREEGDAITVEAGTVQPAPYTVPADWSAAAFWYQVAALSPGSSILLEGLHADGLQGDEAMATLLHAHVRTTSVPGGMLLTGITGPSTPFTADLRSTPDLFQPLAFLMAALGRPAAFTGLHNLPLKETDRLKAVAEALEKLGVQSEYQGDRFQIVPQGPLWETAEGAMIRSLRGTAEGAMSRSLRETAVGARPVLPPFDPQGDHRMAMALAPLALVCREITILHPEVANKSYPGFWVELERAGFMVQRT